MSDPDRRERAMQQYLAESTAPAQRSSGETGREGAILDTEALRERRQAVARAKTDAVAFATRAVDEFSHVANEIGVPLWDPNPAVLRNLRGEKFDKGYVLLRDGSQDELWLSEAFGAVVGVNGRHLLRGHAASSRELGSWVASLCGFQEEDMRRIFTLALTDVPLSTSQL